MLKIALLVATLFISTAAYAESFYLHLAAGQSMLSSAYTTTKNPETYLGLAGYRISSKWGIETSRYELCKMETQLVGFEIQTKTSTLNAVRFFDFNEKNGLPLTALVKIGYARATTSAKGIPAGISIPNKTTKNGLTYGLGIRVALDQDWTLRGDFDSIDTGIAGLGRSQTITGGIGYSF